MAILKFTLAPMLRMVSPLAGWRRMATSANVAPAPSVAAPVVADPGYTITEVKLEGSGKSNRTHATAMVQYVKGHTKKLNPLARQVRVESD